MECDRVFVSACMDILGEQSQGGRSGSEAQTPDFQPRQSGPFHCVSPLSLRFQVLLFICHINARGKFKGGHNKR